MNLTREEQLMVASMVVESHNVSISEAKTNQQLKEDLKLNLEFYNGIKEEGAVINEGFLQIMGNIKDLWTAATKADGLFKVVYDRVTKIAQKYAPTISKFIPSEIKEFGAAMKDIANWLYKTLGYKGFAKGFAMVKYGTFKPSQEQINCLVPFAKIVISILYLVLVALFLIKLIPIIGSAGAAAGAGSTVQAGFGPLTAIFKTLGSGNQAMGMFSAFSAYLKSKDARAYAEQASEKINGEKDKAIKQLASNFKKSWNTCGSATKEVKLTLEQRIDNIY